MGIFMTCYASGGQRTACRNCFSLPTFSPVTSRDGTPIAERDWKCLYPLSCLSEFRIKPGTGHSPFFFLASQN